ncbi:MAG: class II glutamine amidotransferase, partial [Planctomycetota bacterium]
ADFAKVKRELAFTVDAALYPEIEGSTDSELFFYLALTFGLQDDPPQAVERAVGLIERTGRKQGIEHPIQMTVATSDGRTVWIFRYSSEGRSRSLFYSDDVASVQGEHLDHPALHGVSPETRLVVSEPLSDLAGAWTEVPEATCGIIREGHQALQSFAPK